MGKVTHHSIELIWNHVKEKLDSTKRYRYTLQEADKNKQGWGNVYSYVFFFFFLNKTLLIRELFVL